VALFDSIAISTAQQIAKTAGPRAGVMAFKNLLSATSEETRARAALGGIDCALDAGDEHAAYTFAEAWFPINQGAWERDVVRAAQKLEARGWERCAFLLVETEHRRKRGPFIAYAHARLCEARRDWATALAAWESCAAAAESAGVRRLGAVARLELARVRARSPESRETALALVKSVDVSSLPDRQRVQHARILLFSSSRFERAGALSALADLARGTPEIARDAVRAAAAHADAMGARLTPLEADRVKAALAAWPEKDARALALSRLSSIEREKGDALGAETRLANDPALEVLVTKARAVLAGGFGPDPSYGGGGAVPQARAAALALTAIAHAKRGTLAPSHLADVTRALEARAPAPPAAASLCVLALSAGIAASSPSAVHEEAARLASAIIERRGAVSFGFVRLADALASRGRDDVAESALRVAESMGEEGASARLLSALLRRGRAAAKAGKRSDALKRLREAASRSR
jgi:hypothetical protein